MADKDRKEYEAIVDKLIDVLVENKCTIDEARDLMHWARQKITCSSIVQK